MFAQKGPNKKRERIEKNSQCVLFLKFNMLIKLYVNKHIYIKHYVNITNEKMNKKSILFSMLYQANIIIS